MASVEMVEINRRIAALDESVGALLSLTDASPATCEALGRAITGELHRLQLEIEHNQARVERELVEVNHLLVEHSLQGLAIIQGFRVVFANPALARITGYSLDELYRFTPRDLMSMLHPDTRRVVWERLKQRFRGQRPPSQVEIRFYHRDGAPRWLETFSSRVTYRDRPAVQVSCVDVTARREAEEAYRRLVEHSLQGMAILQDERIVFANETLAKITGYRVSELLALTLDEMREMVHPDDRATVFGHLADALAGASTPRRFEFRFFRRDGQIRWLERFASRIEYRGSPAVQIAYMDVTEQKQTREAYELLETCKGAIDRADGFEGAVERVLATICARGDWQLAEGWTPSSDPALLERSVLWAGGVRPPAAIDNGRRTLPRHAGSGLPGEVWATRQPLWIADVARPEPAPFARVEGARRSGLTAALGVPVIDHGNTLAVLLFFSRAPRPRDSYVVELISSVVARLGPHLERKRVEADKARLFEQVSQQREQLRVLALRRQELARRVVIAQEEERRRLSRELHDEAGQALTALKVSLEMVRAGLPADPETHEEHHLVSTRLEEALSLCEATAARLRSLAHNLRPAALDDLGLDLAMEGFCRDFSDHTGLTIRFSAEPIPPLPGATRICLFRFLQEGLTNVARHAGARHVWVRLRGGEHGLDLTIVDDGQGFDRRDAIEAAQPAPGIGLLGLQERLETLDGRLEVISRPGAGTRLSAFVPWPVTA